MSDATRPRPEHGHGLRARRILHDLVLLALLALAVHFVLSRSLELGRAWRAIARFPVSLVAIAAAAEALRFLSNGEVVRRSVRTGGGTLSAWAGAALYLAAASTGLILAGAALTIAVTYRWLKRRAVDPGTASLGSWLPTAFDNLALLVASAIGLVATLVAFPSRAIVAIGSSSSLAVLGAIVAVAFLAVRRRDRAAPLVARIARRAAAIMGRRIDEEALGAWLRSVLDAAASLGQGRWRMPLAWSLAACALDAFALYALFRAAGRPIGVAVLLAGFGLPQLLGRIAPIPGGVGVIEGAMIAAFAALGVPRGTSIPVVLAYRLLSFWIPHLLGFPIAARLERASPNGARAARP